MRVVMLTGLGGPSRAADWAAAAARCAEVFTVTLVAEGRGSGVQEVVESRVPGVTVRRILAVLRRESAARGPFDVLHAHRPGAAGHAPAVARALAVPYVVSDQDPGWYGPVDRRELRRAAPLFRDAAAVLPVSDSALVRLGDLELPGRHRVVPVPLDESALPAVPARARITQDRVRIVATGPLRAGLGWEDLVDAFAAAHAKDSRLRLRIIGDGPGAGELAARIGRIGPGAAAVEVDPGPDSRTPVLHALAHADLCAYPRPLSAFGGAALDALGCGTQVVGVRTGALPELVGHDGGLLVPPGEPGLLADALAEAAAALPRHVPEALAERIRRGYGLDAAAGRLAAVYAEASGRA